MKARQSETPGRVQPMDRARFVAERIRDAMRKKGWVDGERLDIKRLAQAVGTDRYQTAQRWIGGSGASVDPKLLNKQPPRAYLLRIAEALDMTINDLIGIAMGEEPKTAAWRELLEEQERRGTPVTETERASLAAIQWVHGAPDLGAYRAVLAAIRGVP